MVDLESTALFLKSKFPEILYIFLLRFYGKGLHARISCSDYFAPLILLKKSATNFRNKPIKAPSRCVTPYNTCKKSISYFRNKAFFKDNEIYRQ